jgi:hypothetical protein
MYDFIILMSEILLRTDIDKEHACFEVARCV